MKKKKDNKQQEVFCDSESIGAITGRIDPETNDLPLESYYESILGKTGKGFDRLNYLNGVCT